MREEERAAIIMALYLKGFNQEYLETLTDEQLIKVYDGRMQP